MRQVRKALVAALARCRPRREPTFRRLHIDQQLVVQRVPVKLPRELQPLPPVLTRVQLVDRRVDLPANVIGARLLIGEAHHRPRCATAITIVSRGQLLQQLRFGLLQTRSRTLTCKCGVPGQSTRRRNNQSSRRLQLQAPTRRDVSKSHHPHGPQSTGAGDGGGSAAATGAAAKPASTASSAAAARGEVVMMLIVPPVCDIWANRDSLRWPVV